MFLAYKVCRFIVYKVKKLEKSCNYSNALELVETTVGRKHMRCAQELASIIRLYAKSDNKNIDVVRSRMVKIIQKNNNITPVCWFLFA